MDREPVPTGVARVTLGGDAVEPGLAAGTELGRYRIIGRLGAGAMGTVYVAHDPQLDRRIAIKVLHGRDGAGSSSVSSRERLLREAQALARLADPNVVAVHDAGVIDGRVFLAMELVAGVTLRQWVQQMPRSWREILDAVVRAGRGLAAAHAAGLVHRDFKPDNVVVGDDGRVRVLDFGLARTSGERIDVAELSAPGELSEQLTQTGALLGTPAYMAPEQFLGGTIDARTDQFAFCVTAWELVYGERPFRGQGPASLGYAITRGAPVVPDDLRGTPPWLLAILRRGLEKDPDARHPSMDALLGAVAQALEPSTSTRSRVLLGAAATVVFAAGLWIASDAPGDDPCAYGRERVVEVWDEPQRDRIRSAFAATTLPIADDTRARVVDGLAAWTDRWVQQHAEACGATHVRHEQTEATLELRMRCLDRHLRRFGMFVELLGQADAALVQRAVASVEKLGEVDECADVETLERLHGRQDDPEAAAQVQALELDVDQARALVQAGRFADARERADAAAREAATSQRRSIEAEARLVVALAQHGLKEIEPASQSAHRAVVAALAASEPRGIASAMLTECRFLAMSDALDQAARCVESAAGAVEAAGEPTELLATLREAEGIVAYGRGELDAGLAALREAIALVEAHSGESVALAVTVHNYGDACRTAGRLDEAEQMLARAVELRTRLLGAQHPEVAFSLNSLAIVYIEQGRTADAVEALERVLVLRKAAFGEAHDHVAATINNLAIAHAKGHQCAAAVPLFEQAIAMRVRSLGDEHPKVAAMRSALAGCELELGHADLAGELAREALAGLDRAQHPEDHCKAASTLATVLERRGDAVAATSLREGCSPATAR